MSLRTSVAYVLTRIVSGGLAMLSLAMIVRGLGPARYGQLSLGLAASAVVTQVLFNPLNGTVARFFGEVSVREPLLRFLRGLMLGVGGALILLAAGLEYLGWTPFSGHVLLAAAFLAITQGMFDFTGQYLAAAQASQVYSAQFVIKALLMLGFAWLAVHLGNSAEAVLVAMSLAFFIALGLTGQLRAWIGFSFSEARSHWRNVISFAGPMLVTSLLGYVLLWGDRYLLRHLVPIEELGRYSAVADLAQQTLGLVFSGLCTAWYPRIVLSWGAGDHAESQRLYGRYAAMGLAVVLPAAFGFAWLVPDFVPLMYGHAYANTAPALLPLISFGAAIAAIKSYYLDLPLLLSRRMWWHAISIAGSAAASLLLAWCLIPSLGTSGAALGLGLGQLAGVLLSLWAGRGVLHHAVPLRLMWPPVLAVLLMSVPLFGWSADSWLSAFGKAIAGTAVYCLVMLMADFDGIRSRQMGRFA